MNRTLITSSAFLLAGIIVTAIGQSAMMPEDKAFASNDNPFAIKRSAYGRLMARLSESTIDRVWHLGVENVNPVAHSHSHGDGHSHSHDDPSHSHDDHGHSHDDHGHSHDDHGHSHDGDSLTDHSHQHEDGSEESSFHSEEEEEDVFVYEVSVDGPFLARAKDSLGNLNKVKFKRSNQKAMSDAHLKWAKRQVENLLLSSYEMDPLHYGAYNSYHLFLTIHNLGGDDESREHARRISRHSMAHAAEETTDPESVLSGASAAMNLFFMEAEETRAVGEDPPLESLREHRKNVGYFLGKFAKLQQAAEENGNWNSLTTERQREITERFLFTSRTFEQLDAMIARAESRGNDPLFQAEEEIADIIDTEEL